MIIHTTNGNTATESGSSLTPEMPVVMNSTMPTGGVTSPIMQVMTKMMPNWISSMPYCLAIGPGAGRGRS